MDFAKASTHQPCVKKWVEDVILGQNESNFGTLCQSINKKLLELVLKTGKERQAKKTNKGKATISLMIKVFKMLQDPLLEGIIDSTVSNDVRQAIVILVHILNAELEKIMEWIE